MKLSSAKNLLSNYRMCSNAGEKTNCRQPNTPTTEAHHKRQAPTTTANFCNLPTLNKIRMSKTKGRADLRIVECECTAPPLLGLSRRSTPAWAGRLSCRARPPGPSLGTLRKTRRVLFVKDLLFGEGATCSLLGARKSEATARGDF